MDLSTITVILQVMCTLGVYSFLFKHNPYYKLIEHLFVGTAVSWFVAVSLLNVRDIAITPMIQSGDFSWLIPILLGCLYFFQLSKQNYWISRYPGALIVGLGIGLQARGALVAQLMTQIQATVNLPIMNAPDTMTALSNVIFMIMVFCALVTFIYTRTGTGSGSSFDSARNIVAKIGRVVIMATLGVFFGKTVTSRISQFVGRSAFLYSSDALPYTAVMLLALAAMFVYLWQKEKN